MENLFEMLAKSVARDKAVSTQSVEKSDSPALTFKRDENGVLWSYDSTGKKVGRIFEHGESSIDEIKEV